MVRIYKIVVHNADDLCSQEFCSNKPTHYLTKIINKMSLFIPLCEQHAEIMENSDFEKLIEPPIIKCKKQGENYVFHCVYCGQDHRHGIGEGHRGSHCTSPSPYKDTGYILKLNQTEVKDEKK